MRYIRTKS